MKPVQPSAQTSVSVQNTSVAKVLNANVSIGSTASYDSAGNPATFSQDNGDGIMIRVGSQGNPLGLPQAWTGNNVNTTITHNLGRVPIGYYVTKKTGSCDVFDGTVAATDSTITLQCSAGSTIDTIIYIF